MIITFVCQSGILEVQSVLLAMSLRKYASNCKLVASVPIEFGNIHPITNELLKILDVEIVHINNEFNPKYPVGNKIFAINAISFKDLCLFLDSDIILLKKIDLTYLCGKTSVITTGRYDVITHKEWKNIFDLFNLDMPYDFEHVRSPFVCCCNPQFAKKWLDNAMLIWKSINSGIIKLRKVRQVDQISLTITTQQLFNEVEIHDWHNNELLQSPSEVYNFNSDGTRLYSKNNPYFLVLQKGWMYYSRQGHPYYKSNNPNSLAYYPEIRQAIYSYLSNYPLLDQIPAWQMIYDLYFSHCPMHDKKYYEYLAGVEGNQK